MKSHVLAGLQSRTLAHSQQRQLQASQRCQQGLKLLEEASQSGNPQTLQAANEALYGAIQLNPLSAKAHFGLAQLYLMTDHPDRCQIHLKEVLRIDPHHLEARSLLAELQTVITPEISFQLASLEPPSDYDQLHEELAQTIALALQRIAQLPPVTPQANREYIAGLRDQLHQEQQHLNALKKQLQQLEQEWDTTSLHARLRPYEIWIARLETTVDVCGQMLMIKSRIDREQAKVQQLMQQLHTQRHTPQWEAQLEALLDSCDHIADDLDPLDEHYDLSSLTPAYHQLVANLHLLQEQID